MSKPKPCECGRYKFPHRFQDQCRDYLPKPVDPFEGFSLSRDLAYHNERQRELAETVRGQG